jgi:S-DNA-T family DNA segregation ATPase FtsK/SpoIIIE
MANKLKKKAGPLSEKLHPDNEPEVTINEVVKDERTSKMAGAVLLLFTIFLFIALVSYCFTWQRDQAEVLHNGSRILTDSKIETSNLMGAIGAFIAHILIYSGFGVSSLLICTFTFFSGCNLLFGKKIFNLSRNLKYVIAGLLIGSVLLAYVADILQFNMFSFGGAVGSFLSDTLVRWTGQLGTGGILAGLSFAYIIWRFNPTFKWPDVKKNIVGNSHTGQYNPAVESTEEVEQEFVIEVPGFERPEPLISDQDRDPFRNSNSLKEDSQHSVVFMPESKEPDLIYTLVEKDPPPTINDMYKQETVSGPVEPVSKSVSDDATEASSGERAVIVPVPKQIFSKTSEEPILELEIHDHSSEDNVAFEDDGVERGEDILPDMEEADCETDSTVNLPAADYDPQLDLSQYCYPTLDLLETHGSEKIVHDPTELEANKNQIIATLKNYDIQIQRISATVGPTVTLYEIVPAPGVRISRIKNLEDDIALSLAALGIRIIAPIPGKGTIGIEVPNASKRVVSMKTLLSSDKFQNNNFSLPIAIGKKIDNENFIVDLASMPHLLMAGATGQGKSVGINTLLVSLLYKKHPSQLKLVLVDPKKVELSLYRAIEKHFLAKLPGEEEAIITDTKKVVYTLNALCIEMDNRYDLLKEANCRNIKEYNEKFIKRKLNPQKGHQYLPFIVLVIDEFADLIMTAGKEVEMPIARLAQLARAVGIHLIIATQRPSVNIITGTIKANFPARIAFKVSSKIDSRTILDAGGAEQLIGKGDMLVSYNGEITRLQCAFVDTPEVEHVCDFIGDQQSYPQAFYLPEYVDEKEMEGKSVDLADRDSLFEDAARLVVQNQMGSTSLIQRRMKLGYNRAGRLMDQLEMAGVVGPNLGSKARDVLIKSDIELQEVLDTLA